MGGRGKKNGEPKNPRELLEAVEREGGSVRMTKRGHAVVTPPTASGEQVTVSTTGIEHRALPNALAQLRRNGFRLGREA